MSEEYQVIATSQSLVVGDTLEQTQGDMTLVLQVVDIKENKNEWDDVLPNFQEELTNNKENK